MSISSRRGRASLLVGRAERRSKGLATYRLVRYADDFVVMVGGTRQHAEALWDETSKVLAPIGLRLSEEKTRVCHIDEGFDFLGFRIQRRSWRGRTGKRAVYTYPSKKALASVMDKVERSPADVNRCSRHRCGQGDRGIRRLSRSFAA